MSHSQGGGGGGGDGGGFFSFPPPPNGFDDRTTDDQDKMRFHGYESSASAVYDSAGMLSEMFDFGGARPSVAAAPAELLGLVDQQNAGNSAAAAAMHHFFTNPPPRDQPHALVLPDQGFHAPQFTWIHEGTSAAAGGMPVEGQGLSLSLASSLEAEELRMRTTGVGYGAGASTSHELMFFNATQEPRAAASSSNSYQQLHFGFNTTSSSVFSLAAVNVLRNSKYTRPAQELLEEFCSVGRGHHKKTNLAASGNNPTASTSGSAGGPTTKDLPPLSPADRMEHQRRKVKLATMLDEVERRYIHYCEQMQMVVNSFEMVMGLGAAVPYTALAQKAMSRHFRCLKEGIQAELRRSCELLGEKADVAAAGTGITKGETPRLKALEQSLRKQRAFHQMGIMEQEAWRPQRGLPERSVNVLRAWLFEHFLHPYPSDADKYLLARQTGLSRNQVANWFINARVRLWKPMIEEMYQQESKERGEEEEAEQANDDDEEDDKESSRSPHAPTRPPSSSAPATTTTTLAARANTSQQINDSDPSSLYMRHHQQLPTAATAVGPTANAQGFIQADDTITTTTTTTSYSHVDACNHFGTSTGIGGDSSAAAGVGPTMIRFGTTPTAGDVSLTLGLRHGAAAGGRNPPDKTGFSFRDFGRSS